MKQQKLDPVVKKELCFMACAAAVCTALVQGGFVLFARWDYTVAVGGAIGYVLTVLNFFLMSFGVQKAVSDPDPQHAQLVMKASYTWRTVMLLAVMIVSFVVKQIHWLPVVAAVFYPTVVIFIRQFWVKYVLKKNDDPPAGTVTPAPIEDEEDTEDEFEKAISRFAGKIDTDYLKNDPKGSENTERTGEKEE